MGDFVELLFALIAGFFWLFGSSIFRKRDEGGSYQQPSSSENKEMGNNRESGDSEERQRQIREAIRRKIAERRQQSDSEPVVTLEEDPQKQYREFFDQQKEANESSAYARSMEEEASGETFSWNLEGSTYEQEMQKRLQEIEATKRKAEALKKKAKQKAQIYGSEQSKTAVEQESELFTGSIQSALKNPKNAQAAVVYREILGKPVGLRSPSENGLGV